MINTYNETSLHKTLKIIYCNDFNGNIEVEKTGHIYDILSENQIIEIQTKNLSKLLPKALDSIDKGFNFKIVYPLVINKWIETYDTTGKLISKRKSPVTQSIYNIFDELTGLYPVLLNPKFTLDIVSINTIEKRTKLNENVQTLNKSRRFKKNWIKTDKLLKEIKATDIYSKKEDYFNLIPKEILPEFCAKDLYNSLKNHKTLPSTAPKNAHIMIWVLRHMDLIEETAVIKRNHYYKINE